jgi:hypothetical protein
MWGDICATRINRPRFPLILAFIITFNLGIRLFRFKDSFTIAEPQAKPQNINLEAKANNYENNSVFREKSIINSTILINLSIIKY